MLRGAVFCPGFRELKLPFVFIVAWFLFPLCDELILCGKRESFMGDVPAVYIVVSYSLAMQYYSVI
jgi:hypothetical protein